ncbi:bifunctional nuclease family protein [Nesterenkonia sp. HG001]|uniref:bifunctional nuclease family protein n=1 Tax=Nesterenkonia sp. HG001 TaxID=2983207 RepID=UPI002AC69D39|nr:bifunctional nuclease family protein [Nesterenkonia sp. HG001]MDZ5078575.1 bifunctional nuclease family protein [Nesterenkonia sp. HG001]
MTQRQIRLDVVGVRIEVPSHQPVVMLRGAEPGTEDLHVAIMVGTSEATAISMGMDGQTPPRPMTHDLLVEALSTLAEGVESIEIGLLDSSTYFGTVRLRRGQVLDSRASDAIAVAVRTGSPITMAESTLRAVAVTPRYRTAEGGEAQGAAGGPQRPASPMGTSPEASDVAKRGPISADEIKEFQKFLDGAEPEDFGKSNS